MGILTISAANERNKRPKKNWGKEAVLLLQGRQSIFGALQWRQVIDELLDMRLSASVLRVRKVASTDGDDHRHRHNDVLDKVVTACSNKEHVKNNRGSLLPHKTVPSNEVRWDSVLSRRTFQLELFRGPCSEYLRLPIGSENSFFRNAVGTSSAML